MISVKTRKDGEFTISSGQIQTANRLLMEIFYMVREDPVKPHEGDVDWALALRMMEYLPGAKIVRFEPEPLEDGVVY